MPAITLVRQDHVPLTDEQREALRSALFGMLDGLDDESRKSWRRFWNAMLKLEPGEIASIKTWIPRHLRFHRRHMLIEQSVFKAQDRMANFKQFRNWMKVGAGFVDWLPGAGGQIVPVPKSLSFAECDEDAMREFHLDAIAFLRTVDAIKFLWPAMTPKAGAEMIESVLAEFQE